MKPYWVETGNQLRLAIVPRPRVGDWLEDELVEGLIHRTMYMMPSRWRSSQTFQAPGEIASVSFRFVWSAPKKRAMSCAAVGD